MDYLQVTILCFHLITAADIGNVTLPSVVSPVVEGSAFMVTLTLSLPASTTLECDITVTVSTAPGTAVNSGAWYKLSLVLILSTGTDPDFMGLNNVEFIFTPGGSLTQTVTVLTLEDMIVEGNETLSLGIDDITGPGQTGTISSVTLTITDDDRKFTLYSYKCKNIVTKLLKDVARD